MMECPRCKRVKLCKSVNEHGIFWVCPKCDGRAVGFGVLRKTMLKESIDELLKHYHNEKCAENLRCPICTRHMREVSAGNSDFKLDVCLGCQFIWFDPKELEMLPPQQKKKDVEADLPYEEKQKLALQRIENLEEQKSHEDIEEYPYNSWKSLFGMFGLPVECDDDVMNRTPWATWALAAAITSISVLAFNNSGIIDDYSFVPSEFTRHGGITLITAFFLHAGIFHLLSNLYFLIVFGDNVEDFLGKAKYFILILASTVAGGVLHALLDPRGQLPCVGASGGISGIIAFYALQFPHARMGLFFRIGYMIRWINFSAVTMFVFWILIQLFGAWQQVGGFSSVSNLAHLGGLAVGFIFWLANRKS